MSSESKDYDVLAARMDFQIGSASHIISPCATLPWIAVDWGDSYAVLTQDSSSARDSTLKVISGICV